VLGVGAIKEPEPPEAVEYQFNVPPAEAVAVYVGAEEN
jgi:hypothetical protein